MNCKNIFELSDLKNSFFKHVQNMKENQTKFNMIKEVKY